MTYEEVYKDYKLVTRYAAGQEPIETLEGYFPLLLQTPNKYTAKWIMAIIIRDIFQDPVSKNFPSENQYKDADDRRESLFAEEPKLKELYEKYC